MKGRQWGNEFRTTVLCIDNYEDCVPAGTLSNPYMEKPVEFYGVVSLLRELDWLLDTLNFPQPFDAVRSFRGPPERMPRDGPPAPLHRKGGLATFAVRVLFRQNASWQGDVTWQECGQESSFRSALELLLLMDGALRGEEAIPV